MALDICYCTICKLLFDHQPTFDSLILPLHSGSKQLNLTKNKFSWYDLMNFSKNVSAVSFSSRLILLDIQILSNCCKHKYMMVQFHELSSTRNNWSCLMIFQSNFQRVFCHLAQVCSATIVTFSTYKLHKNRCSRFS